MYSPWLQNLRALVSRNSRKGDELGVRLMSTFNIQWEGTVSGNRGLDLLISGTYIPKINWKMYSQNSGIWEADTSIKQRDSTRKTGKSTQYLGWENSSPLSGHILNTASIVAKGRRRQQSHVWKHGILWRGQANAILRSLVIEMWNENKKENKLSAQTEGMWPLREKKWKVPDMLSVEQVSREQLFLIVSAHQMDIVSTILSFSYSFHFFLINVQMKMAKGNQ